MCVGGRKWKYRQETGQEYAADFLKNSSRFKWFLLTLRDWE